jgi:hypothetical protein
VGRTVATPSTSQTSTLTPIAMTSQQQFESQEEGIINRCYLWAHLKQLELRLEDCLEEKSLLAEKIYTLSATVKKLKRTCTEMKHNLQQVQSELELEQRHNQVLSELLEAARERSRRAQGRYRALKHRLKAKREHIAETDLDDLLYHEVKQLISHRVMQFFLKSKITQLQERKRCILEAVREKFCIKTSLDGEMCSASLDKFLPFILERYTARIEGQDELEVRIGIDAVRVGKKSMVTCVVLTFPFLDREGFEDVIVDVMCAIVHPN